MPNRRTFLKGAALLPATFPAREVFAGIEAGAHSRRGISDSDSAGAANGAGLVSLPGAYYSRLTRNCREISAWLDAHPNPTLRQIESQPGWMHFPYSILSAAVLYARPHPANRHHHDPAMLALAIRIGDLLAKEDGKGSFTPRLDSYRDAYMWAEALGLLKSDLGARRAEDWKRSLERNIGLLAGDAAAWKNCPAYTENFLGTSPNHYAWWSATLLTGGKHLGREDWIELGSLILRRFASIEQNPDGYWGEHNPHGPTIGYNYLTTLAVGVYWEHSHDPSALKALQRATQFHSHCTYADGTAVELMNDRNRIWEVSPWAHFAFSHFADGRAYAELLESRIPAKLDLVTMGLCAQNALYYHEGPAGVCAPVDKDYAYRLRAPAGVRKSGPWVVGLAGFIDTPLPLSQWFLDRQANLSLFHRKAGLILAGGNSKGQPQLATFAEEIDGKIYTKPLGSRLRMEAGEDRLALAHHSFSVEIVVPEPEGDEAQIEFLITGRGPAPSEAALVLQLPFRPGAEIETGAGHRSKATEQPLTLTSAELGGSIRHGWESGSWNLIFNAPATLAWPVFPYNPYRNGWETKLDRAVAALRIPLDLKPESTHYVRPGQQRIRVRVRVSSASA